MKHFIALAVARSGSTLLARALEQHPDVRMYGELLSNEAEVRQNTPCPGHWLRDDQDGAEFVRRVVRAGEGLGGATGFKVMLFQASRPNHATAWDELRSNHRLAVIHVERKNLFEGMVSLEVASRTQQWSLEVGSSQRAARVPPFRISLEEATLYFKDVTRRSDWAKTAFSDHPSLDLEYERDLVGDFQGTLHRVFRFLGVAPYRVEPRLLKQAIVPPREQVENFDELREYFAHSNFRRFFE